MFFWLDATQICIKSWLTKLQHMYILAFETSCDDTSVALLQDAQLLSMHTHTQVEHETTAWVVPEVAARLHERKIFELIEEVLWDAEIDLSRIDYFACTKEPGLAPSLLVWKTVAKMLALQCRKPLLWVNHIEAHVFSVFLERDTSELIFPAVVLSASWWHNDLFLWDDVHSLKKLWGTRDDSAWESMDKVWREMWLPFPSGRYIDEQANLFVESWAECSLTFPIPLLEQGSLDFSFSGLKSAALREIQQRKQKSELVSEDIAEISYAYRESVCLTLVEKVFRAVDQNDVSQVVVVGGVSANTRLMELLNNRCKQEWKTILRPASLKYCGDNAAMIGITAYHKEIASL